MGIIDGPIYPGGPVYPGMPRIQDDDAIVRLFAHLIESMGGSIVVTPAEQNKVFMDPLPTFKSYRDDRGNFIVEVTRDQ